MLETPIIRKFVMTQESSGTQVNGSANSILESITDTFNKILHHAIIPILLSLVGQICNRLQELQRLFVDEQWILKKRNNHCSSGFSLRPSSQMP
jgi:hypothetical protein